MREELREYLNPVYDLERLISRISYKSANPRDLIAFRSSLEMIPPIKYILGGLQAPLLVKLHDALDELTDICDLIARSIMDEPPIVIGKEILSGKVIMKKWTGCARPRQTGRYGWRIWKRKRGKKPALKI